MRRVLDVALILVVIAVVTTAVLKRSPKSSETTTTTIALGPAAADVRLGPCSYTNYSASAPVTIRNHARIQLNFVVEVTFIDGAQFFAIAIATYDRLRPNATVRLVASGVSSLGTPNHLTCKITRIQRFVG